MTVSSGLFQTNKYDNVRGIQFNWSINRQDTSGNYTVIDWSFVGYGDNAGIWYNILNGYLNINGVRVFTQDGNKVQLDVGTVLASGQSTIYHNEDGTKTFSADGGGTIYYYTTYQTGSGSWELPPIEVNPVIDSVVLNNKTNNSFNISISGAYHSSSDGRYIGAFVLSGNDFDDQTKIRYENSFGETSGTFEINNSSSGQLNIQSNSTYNIGGWIDNTIRPIVREALGEYTTLPDSPVAADFYVIDAQSAGFILTETSSGTAKTIQLKYRYKASVSEDWGDWVNVGNISNNQVEPVILTGLDSNMDYDIQVKSTNEDGEDSEVNEYLNAFHTTKVVTSIIGFEDIQTSITERELIISVMFSSTTTLDTIYEYELKYKKASDEEWVILTGQASIAYADLSLTLEKNTLYDISIRARIFGGVPEEYGDPDELTYRTGGGVVIRSLNSSAAFSTTTCKDIPLWEA